MDNVSVDIGMAVVAVLTALASWFKNHADLASVIKDREATKSQRDQSFQEVRDKVQALEFKTTALKDAQKLTDDRLNDASKQLGILNTQLAEVLIKLETVTDSLKEIRKNGRRSK